MPERVEFGSAPHELAGAADATDRFTYSYWFARLSNVSVAGRPVLTRAQWVYFAKAAGLSQEAVGQWAEWHDATPIGVGTHLPPGDLTTRLAGAGVVADSLDDQLLRPVRDVLLDIARSELGLLFLDRTRLRPCGFVVGEHLTTVGMAAGEEVVLEQTSFLQTERTNETTSEQEKSGEEERTGSRTGDISDVTVRTLTETTNDGFTAGGALGFEYSGFKVGVDARDNDTVTDADTNTRTTSTKDVIANTTKNVAKLRDLHKTSVRLSATERFERSARRTIRNPNAHTPIDLHMFKVLRRIRFSHERFGVRLCWTPFVKDPAGEFFAAENAMRQSLLEAARKSIPEVVLPPQPVVTDVPGAAVVGLSPPLTELTAWTGWPGSDMSHDYVLPINVPDHMKWDGDATFVRDSLRVTLTGATRGFGGECIGDAYEVVGADGKRTVFQVVHVGATWRLVGGSQLWASLSARVIPDTTSLAEEKARATREWEAARQKAIAERNAKVKLAEEQALVEFEVWRSERRATLNPAREMMRRFITSMFPADARDEITELDVWEQAFEWERASVRLYSGTWHGAGQLRDPRLADDDFVNASWGRLYLPIRTGREETALRWVFLRSQTATAPDGMEELIKRCIAELTEWRVKHLGGPEEVVLTKCDDDPCPKVEQKYVCLGTWSDDIPTDGIHLEVTQAATTAADQLSEDRAQADLDEHRAVQAMHEAIADADIGETVVHLHLNAPS